MSTRCIRSPQQTCVPFGCSITCQRVSLAAYHLSSAAMRRRTSLSMGIGPPAVPLAPQPIPLLNGDCYAALHWAHGATAKRYHAPPVPPAQWRPAGIVRAWRRSSAAPPAQWSPACRNHRRDVGVSPAKGHGRRTKPMLKQRHDAAWRQRKIKWQPVRIPINLYRMYRCACLPLFPLLLVLSHLHY